MERSFQRNDRSFQDNERSSQDYKWLFQDIEQLLRDNKRNDCLTEWTIVSRQQTEWLLEKRTNVLRQRMERLFQTNERSDHLQRGMERNDPFNTTVWNGRIVLTQRNRMEQLFYHNGTEQNRSQTASEMKINGIWRGMERQWPFRYMGYKWELFIDAYCIQLSATWFVIAGV